MPDRTVKAGEHLAQIVRADGFTNFRRIFDLPENAALKKQRATPHVLAAKDKVFIPEHKPKVEPGNPTEQRHRFKVSTPTLKLRLKLLDRAGSPLKQQECRLAVENTTEKLVSDGKGIVSTVIDPAALRGRIEFRNLGHAIDTSDTLLIGALDPIDSVPGQIGRLNNLGYLAGDPLRPPGKSESQEEKPDPDAEQAFRSAVEEFQADHSLTVDGKCGPNTQARLKEAHGC
jgi:hypothetical protein